MKNLWYHKGAAKNIFKGCYIVDAKDRDFYSYSVDGVLLYGINYPTVFIIALCMGKVAEAIFFIIIFQALRTSCGGKHLNTWWSCYIFSCAVIVLILAASGYIKCDSYIFAAVTVLCIICIWIMAPIEHINNPLEEDVLRRNKIKARIYRWKKAGSDKNTKRLNCFSIL